MELLVFDQTKLRIAPQPFLTSALLTLVGPTLVEKPVIENQDRPVAQAPGEEVQNRHCRTVQIAVDPSDGRSLDSMFIAVLPQCLLEPSLDDVDARGIETIPTNVSLEPLTITAILTLPS